MKKIIRMIGFSALAIYVTSYWNKGFVVGSNWQLLLKAALIIAIVNYLIVPITKLVLLPLNILTLGLVSTVVYFLIFYFILTRTSLFTIESWIFPGISWGGIAIKEANISLLLNVLVSALSITTIINLLEKTL
jgi:uncharacterized membrane protein YvlD (DUF360 family)